MNTEQAMLKENTVTCVWGKDLGEFDLVDAENDQNSTIYTHPKALRILYIILSYVRSLFTVYKGNSIL